MGKQHGFFAKSVKFSATRYYCGPQSASSLPELLCVTLQAGLPGFYSSLVNSPRKKKPLFWSESTLAERLHFLLFVSVAVHK